MTAPENQPNEELNPASQLAWLLKNMGHRITTVGILPEADSTQPLYDMVSSGQVPEPPRTRVGIMYAGAKAIADALDEQTARVMFRNTSPYYGDSALAVELGRASSPEELAAVEAAVTFDVDILDLDMIQLIYSSPAIKKIISASVTSIST